MGVAKYRVAVVFPADAQAQAATRIEGSKLSAVALALTNAGAQVVSAPFSDAIASQTQALLIDVDCVLAWYNPFEGGCDRSRLNAMLRTLAARGVGVSAHPDVIDKMGTKELLYTTRHMPWGADVRRYDSLDAMRDQLPAALRLGPRVLKQLRGQSGDGVWKVASTGTSQPLQVTVRHAKRGGLQENMAFEAFVSACRPYFDQFGAMIDQAFQARLNEGMIRCYVVGDRVAGFGEQLINALYPAALGQAQSEAPQPGPRLYFPADRPDFQHLKRKLEGEWIGQLCDLLSINRDDLPVLWDADFMYGEKTSSGQDTYVLCEVNMSSVHPFPPSALAPLVAQVLRRCAAQG